MENTKEMRRTEIHKNGMPGYFGQESASTECELRACRDGLDIVMIQTIFYRTGKSRRSVMSFCVQKDDLAELERIIAEAKTIQFPQRLG